MKIPGQISLEINRLIYRINDPVMRSMFMSPSNRFFMRDGIINMLAGNLRNNFRSVLPILCFKAAYHLQTTLRRWGCEVDLPEKESQA